MALFFCTAAFEQEIPIGDLLLVGQVFGVKRRTLPMYVYKSNAIGIVQLSFLFSLEKVYLFILKKTI